MSAHAKVEALLEEFLPKIRELEDEALARVRGVEEDGEGKIRRHEAAVTELEEAEAAVENLGFELERLPAEVARANLEEDYALEDDLRERYRKVKADLGAAGSRCAELEEEIAGLLPGKAPGREPHSLDARIFYGARVAQAAHEERGPLELLRERLTKAADSAADAVVRAHEENRAEVQSWSNSIQWERSPAGRGGIVS